MAISASGRSRVAVIGAGPAGLMAAGRLSAAGLAVTVFERMPTPARKFLMAGRGGLNLTHSEPLERFLDRYGSARSWLEPAIRAFSPEDLAGFAASLGEPVFTGSSGRVFPQGFKSSPLLRAWLRRLDAQGVDFRLRSTWRGFAADGALLFDDGAPGRFDAAVLALGGASWPRLGADGGWAAVLTGNGVEIAPLRPANCGFETGWTPGFAARFAGQPVKGVDLRFAGQSVRGDLMLTATGIEGGAVYALSALLRDAIAGAGPQVLEVDLRPDLPPGRLAGRLGAVGAKQSMANRLRKAAGLSPAASGLVREATGNRLPQDPEELARLIRAVPVRLLAPAAIDRAISSAGGIRREAVDDRFMLKALPGVFVAGEMLDWEAPTGGYLLQACLATGHAAADGAVAWLGRR